MSKSTAQGRFFKLDSPQATPGVCGVCGYGGPERSYLDPRLDFEYYGTLIFCEDCVMSMAEVFGFILPAQARALEARVEEAERELIVYRGLALNLENLNGSLAALGYVRDEPVSGNLAGDSTEGTDELVEGSDSGEGQPELPFAESSDEPRSDDVRDVVHTFDPFADIRT